MLAYNRLEWLEVYLGLARSGLVAVPINFRLVEPEVEFILADLRRPSADRRGSAD